MMLFSAGVGRSGTLVAVNKLLCEAAETQTIDVLKCIEGLRMQRMYMVQTLVSYMCCYHLFLLVTCEHAVSRYCFFRRL